MPIVRLPNGTSLNFPDGISEDEMRDAIESNFPEFAPKGVMATAKEKLGSAIDTVSGVFSSEPAPSSDKSGLNAGLLDDQFKSGVAGLQSGFFANNAKNAGALLASMDRVDRGERLTMDQDPLGYQDMTPEQRQQARAQFGENLSGNVAKAVQYHAEKKTYDKNENAERLVKLANDGNYAGAWQTFKDDPFGILQQLTVESLPNAIPSLAGGGVGVLAKGGVAGLMTGLATGSYPVEYIASITESLQESGVNMDDVKAVEAKLKDPKFIEDAGKRANTRGTVIAAADAASGKLLAPLKAGQWFRNAGRATGNVGTEVGLEMGGEAAAQTASGEAIKFGDVLAEGLGAGPQTAATTAWKTIAESRQPGATPADAVPPAADAAQPGRTEPTLDPAQPAATMADIGKAQTVDQAIAAATAAVDAPTADELDALEAQAGMVTPSTNAPDMSIASPEIDTSAATGLLATETGNPVLEQNQALGDVAGIPATDAADPQVWRFGDEKAAPEPVASNNVVYANQAEADAATQAAREQQSRANRMAILDQVIGSEAALTMAPEQLSQAFAEALASQGFANPVPTAQETARLSRGAMARDAMLAAEQPDVIPSAPNEMDVESLIPERKEKVAATDPLGRVKALINQGYTLQGKQLQGPAGDRMNLSRGELLYVKQKNRRTANDRNPAAVALPVPDGFDAGAQAGATSVGNPATGSAVAAQPAPVGPTGAAPAVPAAGENVPAADPAADRQPALDRKAKRAEKVAELEQMPSKALRAVAAKKSNPQWMKFAAADILQVRDAETRAKRSEAGRKAQIRAKARGVDPDRDDLAAAVAKLGGIDRESARRQLGLSAEELNRYGHGIKRMFVAGGRSIDDAGEILAEMGYIALDEHGKADHHDTMDKLAAAANGEVILTPQGAMIRAEEERVLAMEEVGAESVDEQDAIDDFADDFSEWEAAYAADLLADPDFNAGTPINDLTDEEIDALFERPTTAADGRQAEENPAEPAREGAEGTGAPEPGAASGAGQDGFALTAETRDEANARIEAELAELKAQQAEILRRMDEDRAEQERKEIAARQEASAENFQLGQSAEDSLSGQQDIFGNGDSDTASFFRRDQGIIDQAIADGILPADDPVAGAPLQTDPTPLSERERLEAQRDVARLNRALSAAGHESVRALYTAPTPQHQLARSLAAVFGVRVQFVSGNPAFEGVATGGVAYLKEGMRRPELAIAGHEVFHTLEQSNPEMAESLLEHVRGYLQENVIEYRQEWETVQAGMQPVSERYAAGEVMADINGAMWLDPKFWREMVQRDANLFRQVAYRFMAVATRAVDSLVGTRFDVDALVTDVDAVRSLIAQTWADHNQARDRQRSDAQAGSDVRFSRAPATNTEAFKRWFGDSVVTVSGKAGDAPLRVYHGTASDFSTFSKDVRSKHIPLPGFFFTPEVDYANRFAESAGNEFRDEEGFIAGVDGSNVMPVYLQLKNPLDVDVADGVNRGFVSASIIKEIIEEAQRKGNDGVILRGWQDGSGPIQYVVFKPMQAKSATGNEGTFDPANPDIRRSTGRRTSGITVASLNRAIEPLRAKWQGFHNINVVQSIADLPANLREAIGDNARDEGFYVPAENAVYLIAGNIASPQRAVWIAAHEVSGHAGLRGLQDKTVDDAVRFAGKNRYIGDLAKAIADDRGNDAHAIEEAMAELQAAIETNDFAALEDRYGITVPEASRNGIRGSIGRVVAAIKKFFADMFGTDIGAVSDADVRALLADARRAVEQGGVSIASRQEPVLASMSEELASELIAHMDSIANRGMVQARELLELLQGRTEPGAIALAEWLTAMGDATVATSSVERYLETTGLPMFSQQEERDLIITHNLSGNNLLHAVRMGGIPVPSLAVTKKDMAMTGFGEITLIGSRAMADPKGYAKTKVFGSDIYSPRYPSVTLEFTPNMRKRMEKMLEDGLRETGTDYIDFSEIRDARELARVPAVMWKFMKEQGIEPSIVRFERNGKEYSDTWKTRLALEEQIRKSELDDKLEGYSRDLLEDIGPNERIFNGYTSSGNRKYMPHTLENVVKILKKELRGGENFGYGVGTIRAHYTPQFKSIADIRKNRDRLSDAQQFEAVKQEVNEQFDGIVDSLRTYHSSSDRFGFSDTVSQSMYDAATMGLPRALEENGFEDVPNETMQGMVEFMSKLRAMPTEYFEAKILREVDLAEFSGAVIPAKSSQKVREALKLYGIPVKEYETEADRARAVREFAEELDDSKGDILFSKSPQQNMGFPQPAAATGNVKASAVAAGAGQRALPGMPAGGVKPNSQGAFAADPRTIPETWKSPEMTKLDNLISTWQDKHIDSKRVVDTINDTIDGIDEKWNLYERERLYHGRSATQVRYFLRDEMKPLFDAMRKAKVSIADLEKFLLMRHVPEANAQIAKVNPKFPDKGSGTKTKDARDYMDALAPEQRQTYESLAKMVDAIVAENLAIMERTGLESKETLDNWRRVHRYYVPLMRKGEEDELSQGVGAGYSVRGSMSERLMGDTGEVVHILANIAKQRESAISRGEKLRVAVALYGLVLKAPNPSFWLAINPDKSREGVVDELIGLGLHPDDAERIAAKPMTRKPNPTTGIVEERIDEWLLNNANNVLHLRINGQPRFVVFNQKDPRAKRMVEALRNLDNDSLNLGLSIIGQGTRYVASMNTQYNPVFGMFNGMRDVQEALINLESTQLAGQQKAVMKEVARITGKVIRARLNLDNLKGDDAALWDEFQTEGGVTGFKDYYSSTLKRAEAIQREYNRAEAPSALKLAYLAGDILSAYNEAIENATRLAVYKVAKDRGLSVQKSAVLAKSITVDFNKKGTATQKVGAFYAFFNAAIQGNVRAFQTITSKSGKKIIGAGLAWGVVQALAMAMAGLDEDEPPEFVKAKNTIIPIFGTKKFISIPMPHGFSILPNTSRLFTEFLISGGKDPGKFLGHWLDSAMDMLNPMGNAGMSLQSVAPTLADPVAALESNRSGLGRRIYIEDRDKNAPTPGHTRAMDSASWLGVAMSRAFNYMTFGDEYHAGGFSPTPDAIDYAIGEAFGGVGREVLKLSATGKSLVTGEELPMHKWPILGRLIGETDSGGAITGKFYNNLTEINEHETAIKLMKKDGVDTRQYREENPLSRLSDTANKLERDLRDLRQDKRKAVEKGDRERVKLIEMRARARMERFNAQVDRVRDRKQD